MVNLYFLKLKFSISNITFITENFLRPKSKYYVEYPNQITIRIAIVDGAAFTELHKNSVDYNAA